MKDLEINEQDTAMVLAPKQEIVSAPQTELSILELAVQKGADINTIERLVALQERAVARRAEIEFNDAMNRAQSNMGPVSADLTNPQTKSKYASYNALDHRVRPIYSREGFSLSFDTGDSPSADMVRVLCYCSHRGGHSRTYKVDMPSDGKGAKGGDVMTKTHATGAAMSYGMRYLLKYIFNIAIGEEDTDGNLPLEQWVDDHLSAIRDSATMDELQKTFSSAWRAAKGDKKIEGLFITAKNTRRGQLCK